MGRDLAPVFKTDICLKAFLSSFQPGGDERGLKAHGGALLIVP